VLEGLGLTAGYGSRAVLRGVDVAVRPGEFVGIIGPNGTGKSTLLKALTGIMPLQTGAVLLGGRPLTDYSARAAARRMAVVPQTSMPAFSFSVREVVSMGRHPHIGGWAPFGEEDRAAVDAALARTDMTRLADRPVDQLSSGELQRAIIARALAQEPEVLLLDEPTAHLDLGHQLDTFGLLVDLAARGLAVLCVSHDLNLAGEYCGRVLLLSEGRVYAEGSPAEVITAPNLQAAYGTLVQVRANPYSGQPVVLHHRAPGVEVEL
jgi:iron complex transport system ATP-binding protein